MSFGAFARGLTSGYHDMRETAERNEAIKTKRMLRERQQAEWAADEEAGAIPIRRPEAAAPASTEWQNPGTSQFAAPGATPASTGLDPTQRSEAYKRGQAPTSEIFATEAATLGDRAKQMRGEQPTPSAAIGHPKPTSEGWYLYDQKLQQIAKKHGLGLEWIMKHQENISMMQQKGFTKYASQAMMSMELGDMEQASKLLEVAYSYFPNGMSMDFVPGEDGGMRGIMRSEATGKIVGKPIIFDAKKVGEMVQMASDPAEWQKNSLNMKLLENSIEQAELELKITEEYGMKQAKAELEKTYSDTEAANALAAYRRAAAWAEKNPQFDPPSMTDIKNARDLVDQAFNEVVEEFGERGVDLTPAQRGGIIDAATQIMLTQPNAPPSSVVMALIEADLDSSNVQIGKDKDGKTVGVVMTDVGPVYLPPALVRQAAADQKQKADEVATATWRQRRRDELDSQIKQEEDKRRRDEQRFGIPSTYGVGGP